MKRFLLISLLLAALLLFSAAAAEPMVQDDDLSGTIRIDYDAQDPSAGSYVYTYRYPHIDESEPDAACVNLFYADLIENLDTNLYFTAEGYADAGKSVNVMVDYQVTCNNSRFFSVLVTRTVVAGEDTRVIWQGHTFSRKADITDGTCDLTVLLGLLDKGDQDEARQARQADKVNQAVRRLVMEQIEDTDDVDWLEDFTLDDLTYSFYPVEDFYLNKRGNPVFYLEPGIAADESLGYLTFPFTLEEIEDEL